MPLRRPSTSDGQSVASSSPSSTFGSVKRRFPLLGRKKNRNSDLIRPSTGLPTSLSTTAPPSPSSPKVKKPCLRVHVQIHFEAPLKQEHVRDYEASPQLQASDRVCQALLSRLQHCSTELISRHDCTALDPLRKPHRDVKPLRYRITYRVERDGLTLVEKSLRSFQEYAPTADDAREVLSAIDRIVGLFLVRHDPGFRWPESPEAEPVDADAEMVRPYTGRPQPTNCIPRSRFVHSTQAFELVPGYSIELFLRSRCATRYPENRNASIKIDSRQPTPLTLLLGEELTTRVSNLIIDPVDSWKRKFDKRHRTCNGFEGSGGCSHVEDGAVDVMVKVRNNLGPDYNYFSHRIQTSKVLFNDPNGRDFDEFANAVKAKLEKARDMSDKSLRGLDDLTLRIRELRGQNWSVHEPLTVRLDSSVTYCRQTVEAIMERLQAGISNVLESHEDALATMTVHKRGHLIFDGFLDGAGGDDNIPCEKYSSPDLERRALEFQLKERIRADITMLCKDTCSLDCTDYLPNLKIRATGASAGPRDNTQPENITRPENSTRAHSNHSRAESLGSGSVRSDHTLNKKLAQNSLREPSLAPSSPASVAPVDLARVPSGVEMAKKYGYMADFIANEEEHQSEPPSTPSLVDTDSISPRDSIVVTPQSARAMPQDQSNEGLRIIDDGRRVIYEEQNDVDAIARGVTEFHRYPEDEPIQLTKEQPAENLERKVTRRSLDTRMPDLSGNVDPALNETRLEATPVDSKPEEVASVSKEAAPVEIPTSTPAEKPESSHEEQWEIVDAAETSQPATSSLMPQEVEVSSKSETSDKSPEPPKEVPAEVEPEVKSEQQTTETVSEEVAVPVEAVEPDVAPASEVTEETKVNVIIDNFPEPPHDHHEVKTEVKKAQLEVEASTRETLPVLVAEDSVIDVEERREDLVKVDDIPRLDALRSSSDSGISLHDQAKEVPKEVTLEEKAQKEIAFKDEEPKVSEETEPELPVISEAKDYFTPLAEHTKAAASEEPDHQSGAVFSLASSPMLEPVVEEAEEEEPPKEFALSYETRALGTRSVSTPLMEKLLTPEERSHSVSHFEEHHEPPRFEPPVTLRPRPRTNTLPERRYSTALTLEIDTEIPGPEWASHNHSPIDAPPKSAIGLGHPGLGRPGLRGHRRQPSAGWLGLREQRLQDIGLRNALVPYRWRALRLDQEWDNRPSTSYSEQ
ncbi:hypothetical protein B0T10DRAFT_395073 [Thelonectria olida]|uniref:Pt repeat family protein n=1 Tax=Thelonectria olida TaxID=1576542 RepID=A0A9P8WGF6_9HYPO|nr:hypothetical protein B0T10DRAFT_395073 [Thelonectria olida]